MWGKKLTEVQRQMDEPTIIDGDSNTPLSEMAAAAGRKAIRKWLNSRTAVN